MTTIYSYLLQTSGITAREAGVLHEKSRDTIKSWSAAGRNPSPEEANTALRKLILKQHNTANKILSGIKNSKGDIKLTTYKDDASAIKAGWPFRSAYEVVIGIVVAKTTYKNREIILTEV